ncbi:MAG: CAP domain-containing protein [Acidimicrobiales bacterium]
MAASVTLVTLAGLLAVPARVGAATADEAKLISLTNSVRASAGAPPLALDGTLSSISRQWAQVMASNNAISHNPNYRGQIEGAGFNWRGLAENVGMGPTVEHVHQALVNSPSHYTNMVNGSYTRVGIGIVSSGGYVWVVQNFLNVAGSTPAPAPAPAPEPTPAPTSPPAPPRTAAPATPPSTSPPTTPAPRPTTTTTTEPPATTTTVAPTTTTTVALPPPAGLPLLLAQMVQQVKSLGNRP